MQRRAAAMYVGLLLVIAVGSIAFISAAEAPDERLDAAEYEVDEDGTFSHEGQTYTVTSIGEFSATVTWEEPGVAQEATISNNTVISSEGTEYRLRFATPTAQEITLRETFPEHDLETQDRDGETYVELEENGTIRLVPEEEYLRTEFGPREERTIAIGEGFYRDAVNATVTVESISQAGVAVSWTGPAERATTVANGDPLDLGDTTFGVNFIGTSTLQLTTDVAAWEDHEEALSTWQERSLGFWGIGVLAAVAAVVLGGMAMLPQRR